MEEIRQEIGIEIRPNQILLQCDLCDFRTTDGNLIHAHLTDNHRSTTIEGCQNGGHPVING